MIRVRLLGPIGIDHPEGVAAAASMRSGKTMALRAYLLLAPGRVHLSGGFSFTQLALGGTGWDSITVQSNHTCGAVAGGGARCWGRNASGQLGDGTTTDRLTPTAVALP